MRQRASPFFSVLRRKGDQHCQSKNNKLRANGHREQTGVEHLRDIRSADVIVQRNRKEYLEYQRVELIQRRHIQQLYFSQQNTQRQHGKQRKHRAQSRLEAVHIRYLFPGILYGAAPHGAAPLVL